MLVVSEVFLWCSRIEHLILDAGVGLLGIEGIMSFSLCQWINPVVYSWSDGAVWKVVAMLGGEACGRKWIPEWTTCLWRMHSVLYPFLSVCLLLAATGKDFFSTVSCCHMEPHLRPTAMDSANPRLRPPDLPWAIALNGFSQIFCHGKNKQPNKPKPKHLANTISCCCVKVDGTEWPES